MNENFVFDKKEQLAKVVALLLPDEPLRYVYDLKGAGTGFIGVTDWRLIFMDKNWGIRKSKKIVSIPFGSVKAVASEDSGGLIFKSSTLILMMGGMEEKSFEFRSNEKAQIVYQFIVARTLKNQ